MSDYVTLEEVKNSLELSNLTYADADLSLAITAASRGIDEYTGRQFSSGGTTEVRYFTPYCGYELQIDDLAAVVSVQQDRDGDGTFETSWVENTDYILEPMNAPAMGKPWEEIHLLSRSGAKFTLFPRSVKVTGTFGWSEVPAGVKQATSIFATRLVRRTRDAPFSVIGLGMDNVAVRIPQVDPDLKFLLDPYTRGGDVMVA